MCVCACIRACMHVCVCVHACVCVRACVHVTVHAFMLVCVHHHMHTSVYTVKLVRSLVGSCLAHSGYDFSQGPTPNVTVGDNPTYASSGHLMAAYTATIPPDTSAPLFSNPFYSYKQEEDDTTPVCTSAGNVVGSAVVGSPDTAHLFSNPLYDFNPKEGGNLMSTDDAVGLIAASPPDKPYHFQNPPYDCDHKDDETETGDNATIHCVEAGLINTSPGDEVCYASIS